MKEERSTHDRLVVFAAVAAAAVRIVTDAPANQVREKCDPGERSRHPYRQ